LTLDESINETDVVMEKEKIKVVYDSQLDEYLKSAVIDYSDSWFGRGFMVKGGGVSHC
jgi:Fe-S cluster assembly iron-binding protein IscA